jgi:hypothetical protein
MAAARTAAVLQAAQDRLDVIVAAENAAFDCMARAVDALSDRASAGGLALPA